ncbi:MAG: ArsR family transcriptional regulator, partial [Euryarchaeota archaeon TMED248]
SFQIPEIENLSNSTVDYALTIEHSLERGFSQYMEFQFEYIELEEIEINLFEFQGIWTNIGTNDESCWMLSNDDQSLLLVNSAKLPSWTPKNGWQGEYLISESNSIIDDCQSKFDLASIEIHSIYNEQKIMIEDQVVVKENIEQEVSETVDLKEVTTVAIVVVSTSSIFALLGVFVMNTESLRIPSTAAGLWLLGLLGKTQETTDGRFQRGRLMGYLTANPGCHFRALMAALNMSNGQITHHLRLLENQELIWRLKDGRLVRYYPLNNSLYPGMDPDQLPIPLLSPDPNSLQGKILTLLDDEHQYGKFPTQAELSVRLEKSQQLISHHLRTLQKFGLVEKRKMGLKNRYKLTKEALFLLETDIDFKIKE